MEGKLSSLKLYLISLIVPFIPLTRWAGAQIGSNVRIISSVKIIGNGILIIGNNTFIGHDTIIITSGNAHVRIGKDVDIAPRVYIGTGSHEINIAHKKLAGKGLSQSIVIGDGTWIGACACILAGKTIGRMTHVAAGAVVTKNVLEYTRVAGIPARVIKTFLNA